MSNKQGRVIGTGDITEHKGKKAVVLAHGESGHAHAFYGEGDAELNDAELIIKKAGASLDHEEHSSHTFEPGVADVTIQREYAMGSLKRVVD